MQRKDLNTLHSEILKLLKMEVANNPVTYNEKLPYQRYDRIKFEGLRWSPEKRIQEYGINKYVSPECIVLDIGCNTGFMAIELAYSYNVIAHGIEPNAHLCQVANIVADYLDVKSRTAFYDCKFDEELNLFKNFYDVILSLAAFHTADGREREDAEDYFHRCYDLMKSNGILIYESVSYNVEEKGEHYEAAMAALSALHKYFLPIEVVTKPSGSKGWVREYFIGSKNR